MDFIIPKMSACAVVSAAVACTLVAASAALSGRSASIWSDWDPVGSYATASALELRGIDQNATRVVFTWKPGKMSSLLEAGWLPASSVFVGGETAVHADTRHPTLTFGVHLYRGDDMVGEAPSLMIGFSRWAPLSVDEDPVGALLVSSALAPRPDGNAYCENAGPAAAVMQPACAWSNAAFLVSGAHMLAMAHLDFRAAGGASAMGRHPVFSAVNGAATVFAAVGSFLFHASNTAAAEQIDSGSVVGLLVCPVLYLCQRLFRVSDAALVLWANLLTFAFTFWKWQIETVLPLDAVVFILLAALVGLQLAWVRGRRVRWPLAGAAVAAGVASAMARSMDASACSPLSGAQGHAAWHVLAALALWLQYAFLRSERPTCVATLVTTHQRARSADECCEPKILWRTHRRCQTWDEVCFFVFTQT